MELIADTMTQLRHLWLNKTSITDAVAPALTRLCTLRVLALGRNMIGDGAVCEAVARMPELRSLTLDYTEVTPALAHALSPLHHLRTLKLTGCSRFGDAGARALASSPTLSTTLAALHVGGPFITNACVPQLQRLHALESLQLWETAVNSVGASMLQRQGRLVLDTQIRCTAGTWILSTARRLTSGH